MKDSCADPCREVTLFVAGVAIGDVELKPWQDGVLIGHLKTNANYAEFAELSPRHTVISCDVKARLARKDECDSLQERISDLKLAF